MWQGKSHIVSMLMTLGVISGCRVPAISPIVSEDTILAAHARAWKVWWDEGLSKSTEAVERSSSPSALLRRLPPAEFAARNPYDPQVQPVSYDAPDYSGLNDSDAELIVPAEPGTESVPPSPNLVACPIPIDLANALARGGAGHLEIQLARERLIEAHAQWKEAQAQWLPSLRYGVGWNKHAGRLQETSGRVLEVNRNSLFFGGGAGYGNVPLAGGASGPARLMVNLSLSDALFEKRAASWVVNAASADQRATMNRALLDIAVAYFDLLEAHGLLANASVGKDAADELVDLVTTLEHEGAGTQAEVNRAKTEQAFWQQTVKDAERITVRRSANLIRLLRLNPHGNLVPVEEKILPIHLVDTNVPVDALISEGLMNRPELAQHRSLVQAAHFRVKQEHLRPWLPHLQAGASGGGFGGGPSSTFDNQGSRGDIDLLAVWELRNIGIGNLAAYTERQAQLRQAQLQAEWLRDMIVADIVTSAEDVSSYQTQMDMAFQRVTAASESYRLNLRRITEREGLPIELLQAIRARVGALDAYTKTVANYNRAQYRLLRSLGQRPYAPAEGK